MNADKPSIVLKLRGDGWLFVAEKNGQGRSRNGGEGEEGRMPCHKLNIIDGKSIDNTIGRNATSPYNLLSWIPL